MQRPGSPRRTEKSTSVPKIGATLIWMFPDRDLINNESLNQGIKKLTQTLRKDYGFTGPKIDKVYAQTELIFYGPEAELNEGFVLHLVPLLPLKYDVSVPFSFSVRWINHRTGAQGSMGFRSEMEEEDGERGWVGIITENYDEKSEWGDRSVKKEWTYNLVRNYEGIAKSDE